MYYLIKSIHYLIMNNNLQVDPAAVKAEKELNELIEKKIFGKKKEKKKKIVNLVL